MLVDNSIVVLENIARHREKGKSIVAAAAEGAREVSMAVTASTLTTVAVFFPLVFVKGIAGQLFRDQALTVTFSLLASLAVALTLIPMLASLGGAARPGEVPEAPSSAQNARGRLARARLWLVRRLPLALVRGFLKAWSAVSKALFFLIRPALGVFQRSYGKIEDRYPVLLEWSLDHRKTVIGLAATLFLASILLASSLGVELIPQLSQGEFTVELKMPPGTPLEQTDEIIAEVQEKAEGLEKVRTSFAVAGTGNRMDANPEQGGENWGELYLMLVPGSGKSDEEEVMEELRSTMDDMPGLQHKFGRPTLFTFKTPIEIEVSGYDLENLERVSREIARNMGGSPLFSDVKSTMETGHPEIQIRFDRERAASLGIPVYQIADRVVNKVRGQVATRYSWHDRKIDVLVRAREEDRNSVERIDTGPGEIRRLDQERVALVSANLRAGDLGDAAAEIATIIDRTRIPTGTDARLAGQNEEMAVSFQSLKFALILAVFLVYLVMASQFESFLHPFVILFTIPLAKIGAVMALWITGSTVSVVVFIGLILLAGIVVNNAIVLIDFINQLRARGASRREAIVVAGRSRLRPIMMTTLTTVLGLLPLALGLGEGAELRAPMAITVIGGLICSTLLTLVVIPVMYTLFDRTGEESR
jgi:HAE1 family hydrophobic/amphiphilic exporter-1